MTTGSLENKRLVEPPHFVTNKSDISLHAEVDGATEWLLMGLPASRFLA